MNLRCGWCSISPIDENPIDSASGLCAACHRILGNTDWKRLLAYNGEVAASGVDAVMPLTIELLFEDDVSAAAE